MKKILVAFAAVFAVLGNSLAAEAAKPLRVAVFVGSGARNVGAFRWLQITTCAKDMESIPVDGASVRNGALDGADVLVMPGGWSGGEAETLEADGREKVKDFVRRGGGYIGTCAGCCLAMESHKTHKDMLHMIPYTFGPGGGAADMPIAFNPLAKEMCGIPKKTWKIRYHGGPVPVPSTPVPEADVKVIATYAGDINTMGGPARKSMARQAAVIAGTYGKGRLFVSAVHPESDVNDHEILRCAFKYVSGREVAQWAYPQRKRGQLAVGVMVEDSLGVEMAKLMQLLLVEREFDIDPISAERISEGALRHLDAVLVPNGEKSQSGKKGLYGDNLARTKEFLGRGGRVFAWGTGAEAARKYEPDVTCVVDAEAAVAALRAFAAEPVPPPAALPAKVPHPLTAAIYSDKEGSNGTIERMLYFSPEYNLRILKAADYASEAKAPMAYLDRILTVFREKGIQTPEAAEAQARALAPLTGRATFVAEDRWRADGDAVRARLLAHAGRFRQVYARNCAVRRIERAAAARFLSQTHSYGDALSRFRYGLFVERVTGEKGAQGPAPGDLVAVATFSKARNRTVEGHRIRTHEWVRYASLPGVRVEGGMGKLLDAFVSELHPEHVLTFADLEWSDGRAYRELGFELESRRDPVLFAVNPLTWERTDAKYVPDTTGMLYYQNFGSLKYRKAYI